MEIENLEKSMGYRFRDRSLLERALTHSSYANEKKSEHTADYERLEFLGDAVLEMVSSAFLYNRYPDDPEGELSRTRAALVCEPALYRRAQALDLSSYIRVGRGEELSGGRFRESIVADVMEAIIGAMYLDSGSVAAPERFIRTFILLEPDEMRLRHDAKTALQELVQSEGRQVTYTLLSETGPDHEKTYRIRVSLEGETLGEGEGRSKKAASQEAAYDALRRLRGIGTAGDQQ